ncbi:MULTISPECIES: TonB system transport protein TonB [Dickeya]|uniref:Protein TonB n=1 Tax=Dickeya oryzae TaxID=1240404 RepID=A0AB39INS4_9GAMM|nr:MULTISPECIES: TonB system transport protein TonB [Dickeya]AJC66273.1 cell envelope protein TonB [Dickeya zeae EC1]MBP2849645.1 TonB system transport protein TonB [Dickeya oryzae]MBP2859480.1 TonB system transport protein TonB [Dickeya oryzae]MCA6989426.1 TonB system transport protein TonB [Dickeya oryzae]MCA6995992.1 TonB system transport protein TonB [Dickeya oryzae]
MPQKTFFLTHRYSWPVLVSVVFHGSLIAGLLFASFNTSVTLPTAPQPIQVMMVNTAPQEAAPAPTAEPEPTHEPEPVPEPQVQPEPPPLPKPVPIPLPEPKPQPKPKPKPETKPKPVKKLEPQKDKPQERVPEPNAAPASSQTVNHNPAPVSQAPVASAQPAGPKPVNRAQPEYPARALALHIEGRVKVQFDVDESGRVGNVRVLSAEPQNLFERDIRQAMRKWRYEENRPGKDLVVTIIFKVNGATAME